MAEQSSGPGSRAPTPSRELGRPYSVTIPGTFWGDPPDWRMEIDCEAIRFAAPQLRRGHAGPPYRVALTSVRRIRLRPSAIVFEIEVDGSPSEIRVQPAAYADRQRLLWELAVRVPDALERGIDGDAAGPAPVTTRAGARATLPPTGPLRDDAASAVPDAATAMSGLDARMQGLGSALVAPASRTPAPPKSGLGCGLFATEPRDGDAPAK